MSDLALAVAAVLLIALGGSTLALAHLSYAGPPPRGPELVVSFKHPGRAEERCPTVTPEENARVPLHMRRDRVCARARAPVRLRVRVDGIVLLERSYPPRGVRGDEPSVALERIAVAPGTRDLSIEIGETYDPREWIHRGSRRMDFRHGARRVVLFDRVSGFLWE